MIRDIRYISAQNNQIKYYHESNTIVDGGTLYAYIVVEPTTM